MAEIVGRKLVEGGQERILHRIYDGLTSNFILDVADSKQSQEHQLIHLVWRRFPRNRSAVQWPKTTCPGSIQTEVDFNVGLYKISGNSINSDTNCLTAVGKGPPDQREFSDEDNSASSSDLGSQEFFSTTGQSKNRRYPEKKDPIQLSNRFDCLENKECPETSNKNSMGDRELSVNVRGVRHRGSPKSVKTKTKTKTNSKTSKISPKPDLSSTNGTVKRKSSPENIPENFPTSFGSVPSVTKTMTSHDGVKDGVPPVPLPSRPQWWDRRGFGTILWFASCLRCGGITVDGSHMEVPFQFDPTCSSINHHFAQQYERRGCRVTFVLEYDTQGNPRATEVNPIHDALSPRYDSD